MPVCARITSIEWRGWLTGRYPDLGKDVWMASDNGADTGGRPEVQQLWRLAPTTYKAGVVMATLGWFLSIDTSSKSTRNGVITSCSYLDIGQFGLAFALIVAAAIGPLANRRAGHALPGRVAAGLSLAFVVAATIMAARGLGWGSGYCTTPL